MAHCPLTGAAAHAAQALLKALNKLPKKWALEVSCYHRSGLPLSLPMASQETRCLVAAQIEQEANAANMEEDLLITEQLEEMEEEGCDEHAETTLMHELTMDFEPFATVESDDAKCPSLHPIGAQLTKELKEYHAFRTATCVHTLHQRLPRQLSPIAHAHGRLNRLRTGTKVVDITFEHEKQVLSALAPKLTHEADRPQVTCPHVHTDTPSLPRLVQNHPRHHRANDGGAKVSRGGAYGGGVRSVVGGPRLGMVQHHQLPLGAHQRCPVCVL